ncbi:DUF6163 family protein [Flaviflagellibacter deserti]|uniref:DUF6163 family protein n=1 Tax=Flaviflagellibacter deserti TaxID=2267266 RepID=A0ABV9YYP2_9HYPH
MIRFLRRKEPSTLNGDEQPVMDWTQNLVLFFRVLAVFQLFKGLVHWALLLGAGGDPLGSNQAVEFLSANIYFAVLDPVSAVGLWLTSSWGAVLWLLAAVSQLAICIAFPEIFGSLWPLILIEAIAIGGYIFLTFKVAQVSDD